MGWQAPEKLGLGVTASGFEGGPSYIESADAGVPQLLFNRKRLPSNAAGDRYVSEQAADGSFGIAVPVAELNSDGTDQRPSIAHNGLDIYFYSNRLGSTPNPSGAPTNDLQAGTLGTVLIP